MLCIDAIFPYSWITGGVLACLLLLGVGKHFKALLRRLRKPLSVPVLNLQGIAFAAASREYYNNLERIVAEGYRTVGIASGCTPLLLHFLSSFAEVLPC